MSNPHWRPDPATIAHIVAWLRTRAENVRRTVPGRSGDLTAFVIDALVDALVHESPWIPSCDGTPAEHTSPTGDPLAAFRARYCDPMEGFEDPDPICVAVADMLAKWEDNGKRCHTLLDAAGVPSAAGAACNDSGCRSHLQHRIHTLIADRNRLAADAAKQIEVPRG